VHFSAVTHFAPFYTAIYHTSTSYHIRQKNRRDQLNLLKKGDYP
jgi:hypothetical protein